MRSPSPAVLDLLRRQHDVVASWQVDERTRRALIRSCKAGHWHRLSWSTFLASSAAPTMENFLWAGLLHCGPSAMIAGRSALVLGGWRDSHRKPIHVLVPHDRQPRSVPDWLRVHRSSLIPDQSIGTLPRVPPHLAAIQAAAWATSDREAMYILISAMQQGLISPARVRETCERFRRMRRRALTIDVAGEYMAGMESMDELAFSRLCRRFGVPQPLRQSRRMDLQGRWRYTDAEFTTASGRLVIVEIDGLHHLDPENWLDDISRQNALMLTTGGLLLRVATWTLRCEPSTFMPLLNSVLNGTCEYPVTESTDVLKVG